MPTKVCSKCKTEKPESDFYRIKTGLHSWCKSCQTSATAAWREKNRESNNDYRARWAKARRQARLKEFRISELRGKCKKYGKTPEWYQEQLARQGGACAICGLSETQKHQTYGTLMSLAIDHDHATGKARGLLCSQCNRTLTRCEAIDGWMSKAAEYLAQYQPI